MHNLEFILIVVMFAFSIIFSASETSLTSLGRLEIQSLKAKGGAVSRLIMMWIKRPEKTLITILIGNHAANMIASAVLTLWLERFFPTYIAIGIAAFTLITIIFAEIAPKIIARQYAIPIAPWSLRFLQIFSWLLFPVIWCVEWFSRKFLSLFGVSQSGHSRPLSEDDVTQTIELAAKEGGIDRDTGMALSNLMEFSGILAKDVMTPRSQVSAVRLNWTLDELLRYVITDGHSRFPVIRSNMDELVGMVLVKDLVAHMRSGTTTSWTRVVRKPLFISEMAPLGTILRDMRKMRTHLLVVRDEHGVFTGVITLEDIIEEIVGEIHDEYDEPSQEHLTHLGGAKIVSGEMALLDFNDLFHVKLQLDESYSTINGYLLAKTGGKLPPVGTLIFDDMITFKVHSISDSGIASIQIIEHSSQD